ncbi:MAG TPA: GTPase [Phycisphaerae bacterium]
MKSWDTIVAVSSAPGAGVRGIVRISGAQAWNLVRQVSDLSPTAAAGWHSDITLTLDDLQAGEAGILLFQEPRSYTGEDVAELHMANSPALLTLLVEGLLSAAQAMGIDARMAEPGEFTARAFFGGKIDLTEAEGIAATIDAGNRRQLQAAASLRQGDLHRWIGGLSHQTADLLAQVEAGIDFVDEEDVRFVDTTVLAKTLHGMIAELESQLTAAVRIDRMGEPPTVVFAGLPNVGKSSLINALAREERSIVSPIAGTTRDMLATLMRTPRSDVRLVDVPGEEAATDELRAKMMAARQAALLDADLIMEVVAVPGELPADHGPHHIFVRNMIDLLAAPGDPVAHEPWRNVSAKTGEGIAELREELARRVSQDESSSTARLVLNHRHRTLLHEATRTLKAAALLALPATACQRPELIAAELRHSLDYLGQISGAISPDEVLGRIFSQFCIGK